MKRCYKHRCVSIAPIVFALLPGWLWARERQEVYQYTIKYSGVPVAHATAGVTPAAEYDGRQVYRLKVDSETNRFASTVFKMKNRYETTVDLDSSASLGFKAIVQQNNLSRRIVMTYDQEGGRALRNGRLAYSIPRGVNDLFGTLLLVSREIKKVGDIYKATIDLGGVFYKVTVEATAAEKLHLPIGIRGAIRTKTVFQHISGDPKRRRQIDVLTNRLGREGATLVLWFSADGSGTLLKASYGQRPFSVTAELVKKEE